MVKTISIINESGRMRTGVEVVTEDGETRFYYPDAARQLALYAMFDAWPIDYKEIDTEPNVKIVRTMQRVPWLTQQEYAAHIGLELDDGRKAKHQKGYAQVRKWRQRGKIPCAVKRNGRWYIPASFRVEIPNPKGGRPKQVTP